MNAEQDILLERNAKTSRTTQLYFVGQFLSASGTYIQYVALSWILFDLTGSASQVGFLVFCRFFPYILFGWVGGLVADRYSNRRVLLLDNTVAAVVSLTLAILAYQDLLATWHLLAGALVMGVVLVFDAPNKYALLYELFPHARLRRAIAVQSGVQSVARIAGPALGGVLLAAAGSTMCFIVSAVAYGAMMSVLSIVRPAESAMRERTATQVSALRAVGEVFTHIRASPTAMAFVALTATLGVTVVSLVWTVLPVLARDDLHGGAHLFGLLCACYAAGALLGALVSTSLRQTHQTRVWLGAIGASSAFVAAAPARNVTLIAALLVIAGAAWTLFATAVQLFLQLGASRSLQGRIASLYIYAIVAPAPFGALLAGYLCDLGGSSLALLLSGLIGLTATGVSALWLRTAKQKGHGVVAVVSSPSQEPGKA